MFALGLSISLVVFWGVTGLALLAVLHTQRNLLRNMLLAPVVGVAATVLPILFLSRAGLPVSRFGIPLTAALLLLNVGLIWRLRPVIPLRHYLPFAGVLMLALLMTGWPMLEFGFDWVSFSNDDMANYVLAAHRLVNHGFMDIPNLDELVRGRDYTLIYWFMDVIGGHRPGSQLLLAWVVTMTGLTGHQIFMPVILALHLALISATGALVCQSRRFHLSAKLTCALLGLSALNSLGALYQLIAQVGGLALLAGCGTVLLRPLSGMRSGPALRLGILVAILLSALLVVYPEVAPLLALAFALYAVIGLVRRRLVVRPLLAILGTLAAATPVLVGRHLGSTLLFLLRQMRGGLKTADPDVSLFPYYLIPSGLANLWGLQKVTALSSEPWLSTSILLGGVLLLAVAGASTVLTWRGQPAATFTTVMLALGIYLFTLRGDFGLFKLAMIIQPFMLATLVIAWLGVVRQPPWRIRPLILLALIGLYSQVDYVEKSRGLPSRRVGALLEIPDGSRSRINAEFRQLVSSTGGVHLVSDTPSIVLAKFQALYTRRTDVTFSSRDFFSSLAGRSDPDAKLLDARISTASDSIREGLHERLLKVGFTLFDDREPGSRNEFVINTIGQQSPSRNDCGLLIAITGRHSVFNRRRLSSDDSRNFVAQPCSQVRNHLIFINSRLGEHYYGGDARRTAVYQLERDLMFTGQSMSGVGRHLLFQSLNPSQPVRLLLDLTATFKSDGENRLPAAVAIGTNRQSFPIVGRGSARVISPPLTPQSIREQAYVAIDMGVNGQRFPDRRIGPMSLYGTDIPRDRRLLVGFARNISLISDEEYLRLSPPNSLDAFPADLTNPDVEYSGLYEDGWVSEAAFVRLTQPSAPATVAVRGTVPKIGDSAFTSELRVLVDQQEVARRVLGPGEFDVQGVAPPGMGRRRVDLRFSNLQRLPGKDRRQVAARLRFVGFEAIVR